MYLMSSRALDQILYDASPFGDASGQLSQKNFAALQVARTSKTFYEPAMDLLWADMGSYRGLGPL